MNMILYRKYQYGLIYGLTAGLFFALAAWGWNAALLSQAHFALPFLPFFLGILPVLLISGLVGYLTISLDNALLGGLCWLLAGILLAILGVWTPLWLTPTLLPYLAPALKGWLIFPWFDAYTFLTYSAATMTAIAFLILGLIETVLVEQAAFSTFPGAFIMPALICALVAATIGGVVDNMVNTRFRISALALDRTLDFALENKGKLIEPALARGMHLSAVSAIEKKLTDKHRLFYFQFNETGDHGQILVDLNGNWALCDVFQDQPGFCQPASPPSQK